MSIKRKTAMRRTTPRFIAYAIEFREITPALRARCSDICEMCGAVPGSVAHHRLRRSQGGKNTLENLRWLCHTDHEYIHKHPDESYKTGWLLRRKGK